MRLELVAWELEERLTWEKPFFEYGFIPLVEYNEGTEIINEGLHDPYELDDPFCDRIYSVEDEFSSMVRLVDG